jgi:hypothetical protein
MAKYKVSHSRQAIEIPQLCGCHANMHGGRRRGHRQTMDLQPIGAGLLIASIGKIASFRIAGALLCVLCVPFAIFAVKSFLPQRTQRKTQRTQRKDSNFIIEKIKYQQFQTVSRD